MWFWLNLRLICLYFGGSIQKLVAQSTSRQQLQGTTTSFHTYLGT